MKTRTDDEIEINRIAQGIETMQKGLQWFQCQAPERQLEILRYTVTMISQAHPHQDEVYMAMQTAGLKLTFTPLVLLSRNKESLPVRLAKILRLPAEEYSKSFRVLLRILAISDGRRKATECSAGCSHWWHQDLASPEILSRLRASVRS
jgi:hypothetical protein